MSVETELHEVRAAFDRAMADATETASSAAVIARSAGRWSRPRTAVVAFAVAACVAGVVGVVAQINSRGGPATTVSTLAPTGSSSTSTATSPSTTEPVTSTSAGVALTSVHWDSVVYPITAPCGDGFNPPVVVLQVDYAAPAPGVQLALVMARCNSGAGTPSIAVYVYDGATATGSPHLAGTLVRVSDGWQARSFSIEGGTIDLAVDGFSSNSVPNCCPDVHASLDWSWNGSGYELTSTVPAHAPGAPGYGGY